MVGTVGVAGGGVSSGAYYGTWGGSYVGVTEDGFEIEQTYYTEPIRGDNMGDSIQDEITRGGDCYVNMVLIEYLNAILTAPVGGTIHQGNIFHPHATIAGKVGFMGLQRRANSTGVLALTEYSNSVPVSAPNIYTFPATILASNFPMRILLANRLKRVPMRMIAYPDNEDTGGLGSGFPATSYTEAAENRWYYTNGSTYGGFGDV